MKKSLKTIIMSGVAAFVFAISGCKWFEKEPTQEELFEDMLQWLKLLQRQKSGMFKLVIVNV